MKVLYLFADNPVLHYKEAVGPHASRHRNVGEGRSCPLNLVTLRRGPVSLVDN